MKKHLLHFGIHSRRDKPDDCIGRGIVFECPQFTKQLTYWRQLGPDVDPHRHCLVRNHPLRIGKSKLAMKIPGLCDRPHPIVLLSELERNAISNRYLDGIGSGACDIDESYWLGRPRCTSGLMFSKWNSQRSPINRHGKIGVVELRQRAFQIGFESRESVEQGLAILIVQIICPQPTCD